MEKQNLTQEEIVQLSDNLKDLKLANEYLKKDISNNYIRHYDEIEYFSKEVSLGKNCFPVRTRYSNFRKELCRLTVRNPINPFKSIADTIKSVDRVVVYSDGKIRYDSDIDECKTFLTELTEEPKLEVLEVVASDGKLRKFMEESIQIVCEETISPPNEDEIQFCCLVEMAFKANVPRQIKLQSINKTDPQWVMSRFEKFTKTE